MLLRHIFAATLAVLALAFLAAFVVFPARAQPYTDSPTSQWFKSLSSPAAPRCCDQADCRQAVSDYRVDGWWAQSNTTGDWVKIGQRQLTGQTSIFAKAILCEGAPIWSSKEGRMVPFIYCFTPPPIGF